MYRYNTILKTLLRMQYELFITFSDLYFGSHLVIGNLSKTAFSVQDFLIHRLPTSARSSIGSCSSTWTQRQPLRSLSPHPPQQQHLFSVSSVATARTPDEFDDDDDDDDDTGAGVVCLSVSE